MVIKYIFVKVKVFMISWLMLIYSILFKNYSNMPLIFAVFVIGGFEAITVGYFINLFI